MDELIGNIAGAILTGILGFLIALVSVYIYNKSQKDKNNKENDNRLRSMENSMNSLLSLTERIIENEAEVRAIKENCYTVHNDYNSQFNRLNSQDDMAAKDIERLLREISGLNVSVNQLKDSNVQLASRVDKLLALNEMKNIEQDKKLDKLFEIVGKEK